VIVPVLYKLFNAVLSSGNYPQTWSEGYIKPLHKKENPLLTNNYRGITITSIIGKLFNSIINSRIDSFLSLNKIMKPEQIGFRKKCRTADHIFVIKTLIQQYKKNRKPIYACLIDLHKAFDSVCHEAMFYKLLSLGMNGSVYRIIKDMYSKTKLQVHVGTGLTDSFNSVMGVKQGDNLSPTLFNIFLNDLPNIFDEKCNPVQLDCLQINSLLYADDLVILSESVSGLQCCLNKMENYCNKWGLMINTKKTKVITFNPPKTNLNTFTLDNTTLEVVNEITYLGVTLTKNGSFTNTMTSLFKKSLKGIFKLKRQLSILPAINCSLHLFDHMIKPILLYGSEVWAFSMFGERNHTKLKTSNIETLYNSRSSPVEKSQIKFAKMCLGVGTKTDTLGVYGELGLCPLYIDAIDRMLKYWLFIEEQSPNIILQAAYKCSQNLHNDNTFSWYSFALKLKKIILHENCTGTAPSKHEISLIKRRLTSRYAQFWRKSLMDDSKTKSQNGKKLRTYRNYKILHQRESYLSIIRHPDHRRELTKFRLSAHRLMIELGRHIKLKVNERVCPNCQLNQVEDEAHFLLSCPL
jgi:hypothetical protein